MAIADSPERYSELLMELVTMNASHQASLELTDAGFPDSEEHMPLLLALTDQIRKDNLISSEEAVQHG